MRESRASLGPIDGPLDKRAQEGHVVVEFESVSGKSYILERSPFIDVPSAWGPVPGQPASRATGPVHELLDPSPEISAIRFYRVQLAR